MRANVKFALKNGDEDIKQIDLERCVSDLQIMLKCYRANRYFIENGIIFKHYPNIKNSTTT